MRITFENYYPVIKNIPIPHFVIPRSYLKYLTEFIFVVTYCVKFEIRCDIMGQNSFFNDCDIMRKFCDIMRQIVI